MSVTEFVSTEPWVDRYTYPFKAQSVRVDGGMMRFVDEGYGEPLLFLHGFPTWSYYWRNVISELSESYRCIAPDFIGFGQSDKPGDWSYSPISHARNLDLLVESLALRETTVIATDFGGPVGISAALMSPSRFKKLILMNTWLWDLKDDPPAEQYAKKLAGPMGKLSLLMTNSASRVMRPRFAFAEAFTDEAAAAYAAPYSTRDSRKGLYAHARQMLDAGPVFADLWRARSELRGMPVQLLWGLSDPVFGDWALNRMWEGFPHADVKTFPGVGPFLMEEKGEEVTQSIREFVSAEARIGYLA